MERRTVVPSGADSPHYSTVKDAKLARLFQAAVPSEIFTRGRADLFNEFDAPLSRIPRAQSEIPFLHELTRKMKARDFFFLDARRSVYRARFLSLKRDWWISGAVFRDARAEKKKSAFKFSARFERVLCDRRSTYTRAFSTPLEIRFRSEPGSLQ